MTLQRSNNQLHTPYAPSKPITRSEPQTKKSEKIILDETQGVGPKCAGIGQQQPASQSARHASLPSQFREICPTLLNKLPTAVRERPGRVTRVSRLDFRVLRSLCDRDMDAFRFTVNRMNLLETEEERCLATDGKDRLATTLHEEEDEEEQQRWTTSPSSLRSCRELSGSRDRDAGHKLLIGTPNNNTSNVHILKVLRSTHRGQLTPNDLELEIYPDFPKKEKKKLVDRVPDPRSSDFPAIKDANQESQFSHQNLDTKNAQNPLDSQDAKRSRFRIEPDKPQVEVDPRLGSRRRDLGSRWIIARPWLPVIRETGSPEALASTHQNQDIQQTQRTRVPISKGQATKTLSTSGAYTVVGSIHTGFLGEPNGNAVRGQSATWGAQNTVSFHKIGRDIWDRSREHCPGPRSLLRDPQQIISPRISFIPKPSECCPDNKRAHSNQDHGIEITTPGIEETEPPEEREAAVTRRLSADNGFTSTSE
ncbi:hypothetical protein WN55_02569 [Dufourea novaeangliae]|uniref:Uncharacterized protein n=1 Tax=Dufourea novaeangliae TaxID=178035 RepID=A0A154PIM8_DUFNO|nr:hypothetical protein WN55_02569 [Dufourea novaeangliae]